jgi:hypothetical protein
VRLRVAGPALVVTAVVSAAACGTAFAGQVKFGSSLSATASKTMTQGVDTALWARTIPGRRAGAPATGRVAAIKLKGCAVENGGRPPLTQIHFQTLRPGGGSAAKVYLTSGPFNMPVCGHGGSGATVTTFHPVNLCAHKGDFVDFNDEGGFAPPAYPNGVPYQVLAAVAGSTTSTFTGGNATNNGSTLAGHSLAGTELLMQMTLATGRAAGVCQHPPG